jgi:hypothetical protein
MSRIRSIHPGIWTDEAFMSASAHARLLLLGIWTEAWDDGVFEWKPLTLKARIFPVDGVDVAALLAELETLQFIRRFQSGGKEYGAIRNFQKYQRPKKPNSSGVLPSNLTSWAGCSVPVPNQSETSGEKSPQMEDGGWRMEGEREKETANAVSLAPAPAKPAFEIECRNLVGEEPVLLALDFHKLSTLVESGTVTETDVKDGIRAAMAKPDFRIRHWSQLEGWARGAAKERLAGNAKAGPKPIVVSMTPEDRAAALAKTGTRWVEYDTAEWSRVADLWKADKGKYPPHPQGGWYFPESYFAAEHAA